PTRIAKQAGTRTEKTERQEARSEASPSGEGKGKEISLNDLHRLSRGTFNLSDKMGELLKPRYKFTTLTGIRDAYSAAFNPENDRTRVKAIDDALADKSHDALNIVRNCIVHKGGFADWKYVKDAKTIPAAPQVAEGEPIPLDGEIVQRLIDPVTTSCARLI